MTDDELQAAWDAAPIVYTMESAPKNNMPILARDAAGELALIRWRTYPDVDKEDDDPYWGRFDTDELFEPVAWVPSPMSIDDILKFYG